MLAEFLGSLCLFCFVLPVAFVVRLWNRKPGAQELVAKELVLSFLVAGIVGFVIAAGFRYTRWGPPGTDAVKLTFPGKRANLERLVGMLKEDEKILGLDETGVPYSNDASHAGTQEATLSNKRESEYRALFKSTGCETIVVYSPGCILFTERSDDSFPAIDSTGYAYLDRPPSATKDGWSDSPVEGWIVSYVPLSRHWYLFWHVHAMCVVA